MHLVTCCCTAAAAVDNDASASATAGSHIPQTSSSAATDLPASPMPLNKLFEEMQSPTTRKLIADSGLLDEEFTFAVPIQAGG